MIKFHILCGCPSTNLRPFLKLVGKSCNNITHAIFVDDISNLSKAHKNIFFHCGLIFVENIQPTVNNYIRFLWDDLHKAPTLLTFSDWESIVMMTSYSRSASRNTDPLLVNPAVTDGFTLQRVSNAELMFYFLFAWTSSWSNCGVVSDLRFHDSRAHVTVMNPCDL